MNNDKIKIEDGFGELVETDNPFNSARCFAAQIVVAKALGGLPNMRAVYSYRIGASQKYGMRLHLFLPGFRTDQKAQRKAVIVMLAGIVEAVRDLPKWKATLEADELMDDAESAPSPFGCTGDGDDECVVWARRVPKIDGGIPANMFIRLRAFLKANRSTVSAVAEEVEKTPFRCFRNLCGNPRIINLEKTLDAGLLCMPNGGWSAW